MKTFIIIGCSGSGKDTVADIIKDYYNTKNLKTIITGYAKYLKLYAYEMLDWHFNEADKPRAFLQKMGSFIRIDMDMPKMLSDRLLTDMDIYKHFYDIVVVSDARLPEEIYYLKNNINDVIVIKVVGEINKTLTMNELQHETETASIEFKDYDYLIDNNSDYNSLRAKVVDILKGEK